MKRRSGRFFDGQCAWLSHGPTLLSSNWGTAQPSGVSFLSTLCAKTFAGMDRFPPIFVPMGFCDH
jgi:hypothetical protein